MIPQAEIYRVEPAGAARNLQTVSRLLQSAALRERGSEESV